MGAVNIMDTFITLFIVVSYLVIVTECNYKPIFPNMVILYVPKMCRQLCEGSNDTFLYVKEDLSCHWIPGHDVGRLKLISARHVDAKSHTCSMKDTVITALDICCPYHTVTGEDVSLLEVEMSTSGLCSKDLRPYQARIVKVLHQACAEGNLGIVKGILSKGLTDINCRGLLGKTPIMVASEKGHINVFDYLLSQGSDLAAVDRYRNNVLHLACRGGNIDIVTKLVVDKKYDIESRGKYDETPVMMAVAKGHENIFDFLAKKGCNLLVVSTHRYNLLHLACIGGNVKIVRKLLRSERFDMEERGRYYMTPVMTAVLNGKKSVFHFLVSKGSDLSVVDSHNRNVLYYACSGGNVDIVKYLVIKRQFDIEAKGDDRCTPAMIAARREKIKVFDFLVSRGCNLTAVSKHNYNILHIACNYGRVKMVRHLINQKLFDIESRGELRRTSVMIAAKQGKMAVVKILVKENCKLDAVDNKGDTVLHVACRAGKVDVVKYLISLKVVRGLGQTKNKRGQTPIQVAKGHVKVVSLLKGMKSV